MPGARARMLSGLMAVLFLSMALPGCLSLVVGREMMEGARGPPEVRDVTDSLDLSHVWQSDGTNVDAYHEIKTGHVRIDPTVETVIINFQVSMGGDDLDDVAEDVLERLAEAGVSEVQLAQRYVEVWLYPCDETGENCDDAIFHERTNNSLNQTRLELDAHELPRFGKWRLVAEGQGVDTTVVPLVGDLVGWQDAWTLRVSVIRPCLSFPEDPETCTATIEFA